MGYSPFLVSGLVCLMAALVGADMRCPVFRQDEGGVRDYRMENYSNQCPSLINPQDEYCCYDLQLRSRCCNLNDFLVNMSVLAVIVLIVLMLLATLVSCVCCICCPFCFLYKRRHAGRVHRRKPADGTSVVPEYTPIQQTHKYPGAYPADSNPVPEYTPIQKTHPKFPGAYPVLPPTAEIRSHQIHR